MVSPDAIAPDFGGLEEGTKLICQIDQGGHRCGDIRDDTGFLRWRYASCRNAERWSLKNPFSKWDFVVVEAHTNTEIIIRRASFIPPVFKIIEANRVVGSIRLLSLLRNRYSITISGITWTFCMPLFTILFYANSRDGTEMWVEVGPTERQWNILVEPGVAQARLIAALAFIHNERYSYG
jgi:hypothetical protein